LEAAGVRRDGQDCAGGVVLPPLVLPPLAMVQKCAGLNPGSSILLTTPSLLGSGEGIEFKVPSMFDSGKFPISSANATLDISRWSPGVCHFDSDLQVGSHLPSKRRSNDECWTGELAGPQRLFARSESDKVKVENVVGEGLTELESLSRLNSLAQAALLELEMATLRKRSRIAESNAPEQTVAM